MIDMVSYWNKIQILYSHISICPMSPCFLRPFLSLLPSFLLFKSLFHPPFSCLYNLLTVPRGSFTPIIGVIHLSLLASLALLSLFFFFSFFSSFLFLSSLSSFSHSLSLQIFGAATAAMPHRFRRAWTKGPNPVMWVNIDLEFVPGSVC